MDRNTLLESHGPGAPEEFRALARSLVEQGEIKLAATAFDRAFGLAPDDPEVAEERAQLLNQLAVERCGLVFRYVPGGTFLMGSETGEPDEVPVHPVRLEGFWITETPVSWGDVYRILGWGRPMDGPEPGKKWFEKRGLKPFEVMIGDQIRMQYCEDHTERARDWHAHSPPWASNQKQTRALFGSPSRSSRESYGYSDKPMVGVSHEFAKVICEGMAAYGMNCRLPTEAEWEKSARGGLVDCPYPWGRGPANEENCDLGRFHDFAIRKSRTHEPNGYGLYATSGGVWEWTADWYDAEYYRNCPGEAPKGPAEGMEKVLRGGSWADCPEVVTSSFRMSMGGGAITPNAGFRVCVTEFWDIPEGVSEPPPVVEGEVTKSSSWWRWLGDIFRG